MQTVAGETGCFTVVVVLLAAGGGMLLDFWVLHLHPVFSIGLFVAGIPLALYLAVRRTQRMEHKPPTPDYARNLALAAVAGQSGCVTIVVIVLALFAGMFLDSKLDMHPVFTIGLVIASVPVSLYVMIRMMLSSISAINLTPSSGAPRSASSPATTQKENGS